MMKSIIKCLECYLIQPLTIGTYNEVLTKDKPTIMIKNYPIQPLPKGTSNDRLTNGIQTMETKRFTIQLSTKGHNYDKKLSRKQPCENSTASTLYNDSTTTSIKGNTHLKYDTTKNLLNHNTANMLTIIWLQYMCKYGYLIFMVLLTRNWYLLQWSSSIHSSSNITQIDNTCLQQKNYINQQALTTSFQPHFEELQEIKPGTLKLLSKS